MQFQPKVFPCAGPASCYRHNGKWVNQSKGGKDVNRGFAIPWSDESLFLMPPIGDCHRMVEKVHWEGGRGIAVVPVFEGTGMVLVPGGSCY